MRGVATYFLRLLQNQYDVVPLLCNLVQYPRDDWYVDNSGYPYHPIRDEAVSGLGCNLSPQAWEALIGGYFVNPSNFLDYRLTDTIEDLTAFLMSKPDSETIQAEKEHRLTLAKKGKPTALWFDVLSKMDHELDYYLREWDMTMK